MVVEATSENLWLQRSWRLEAKSRINAKGKGNPSLRGVDSAARPGATGVGLEPLGLAPTLYSRWLQRRTLGKLEDQRAESMDLFAALLGPALQRWHLALAYVTQAYRPAGGSMRGSRKENRN